MSSVPVRIVLVPHATHSLHLPFRTPLSDKLHSHRDEPASQRLIMTAVRRCSTRRSATTPHTHCIHTTQLSQSCPSPAAPLNNHRQPIAWIHNGYALRATEGTCTVPVCIAPLPHTTHLLHVPFRTSLSAKLHPHPDKPSSQRLIMTAVRCCSTCRLRYHATHA